MSALVIKEIRLVLPAWIAAMLLATVPVWLISALDLVGGRHSDATFAACAFFALGAAFLGLAPFGQECSCFSLLLAQPVTRRTVWRAKVAVVAVAQVLALEALLLSYSIRMQELPVDVMAIGGLFALAAFAGGLWTTLLFRQVAAALWFTLFSPIVILMATAKLWEALAGKGPEAIIGMAIVLVLYSVGGFFWARRLFLRAQDIQWTGGAISLPGWLGLRTRTRAGARKRGPLGALIRKEFDLHQVSLLIGAGMLLLHLVVVAVRKIGFDPGAQNNAFYSLLEFWWAVWFGLPFLVGSTAVAEERKLGTLESQLCVPTTRRAQFALKFALALSLGIFLGGLMPWVAESIGGFDVVPFSLGTSRNLLNLWPEMVITCLISAGITFISFYASTLARNLLQAMGTATAVGLGLAGFAAWAFTATVDSGRPPPLEIPLIGYIGLPVILVALIWLSFKNHKHVHVGWNIWSRNLLTIFVSLAFAFTLSATIYHRPWELLMTLEPHHGPPQLSGSVRPTICSAQDRLFALLPNGRLWVASRHKFWVYEREGRTDRIPIPVDGVFMGKSPWVNLASSFMQVVGIQSEGSLWRFLPVNPRVSIWTPRDLWAIPKLERIGADSDWKLVAGGGGHFLALKKDGTLWGWGNNHDGELGAGPAEVSGLPVRIGTDSDWAAIFASGGASIGVKRDGSVWKWGNLLNGPAGLDPSWKRGPHPSPVRWGLDGTGWLARVGGASFDLVLRQDHTLWATGILPNVLFGNRCYQSFSPKLVRVGSDADWVDVAGLYRSFAATKQDGRLILNDIDARSVFWGGNLRKPSKYSDWLAVGFGWYNSVALAADGTLSGWGDPFGAASLLGPSRKPLWSLNVMTAKPASF